MLRARQIGSFAPPRDASDDRIPGALVKSAVEAFSSQAPQALPLLSGSVAPRDGAALVRRPGAFATGIDRRRALREVGAAVEEIVAED